MLSLPIAKQYILYRGDSMEDKTVQMAIRLTIQERELIKEQAEKAKKSMNQYVLDLILYQNDSSDSTNTADSIDGIILREQLAVKDSQIKELQKLLNQQQQLSLSDKAELQKLQLKLHDNTSEPQNEQKKTFWQRVFNL